MKKHLKIALALTCITAACMAPAALASGPAASTTGNAATMTSQEEPMTLFNPAQTPQMNNSNSPMAPTNQAPPYANQALVYTQGTQSVTITVSRLENDLKRRGIPLFAKFDHAQNAKEVGLPLRPTTVLVFGAPKVGTGLMQMDQSVSVELPLRISVWEDAQGHTWLAYPDPVTQMAPYDLQNSITIKNMAILLNNMVRHATQ